MTNTNRAAAAATTPFKVKAFCRIPGNGFTCHTCGAEFFTHQRIRVTETAAFCNVKCAKAAVR